MYADKDIAHSTSRCASAQSITSAHADEAYALYDDKFNNMLFNKGWLKRTILSVESLIRDMLEFHNFMLRDISWIALTHWLF